MREETALLALIPSRFSVIALAIAGAVLGLPGCERQPVAPSTATSAPVLSGSSAADPYDTSKMDFTPGPAKVSSERHTGPFAAGDALSLDATVKPLSPNAVKEIRLDTTHKIIENAPGVKFSAWTFGDQVPGPVVGARVGDRIKFSMTNRSDETAPGLQVMAAPMMHSMDFHAAMVSPQDKYRSVAPRTDDQPRIHPELSRGVHGSLRNADGALREPSSNRPTPCVTGPFWRDRVSTARPDSCKASAIRWSSDWRCPRQLPY